MNGVFHIVLANVSVAHAGWRGGAAATSDLRQDKRAHIAWRSGGCFCLGFFVVQHIARLCRNVRQRPNTLSLRDFLNIAVLRHGR